MFTFVKSLNSSEGFHDYKIGKELFLLFCRKGYFHLSVCFQKIQGYTSSTTNRQPSIWLSWLFRYRYMNGVAGKGAVRCNGSCKVPHWAHPGPLFSKSSVSQIHFLVWLPGGRLSYMCLNFWFYFPKSQKVEDNKMWKSCCFLVWLFFFFFFE